MYELQRKAINAARTVLFNDFRYDTGALMPEKMYIVWFCKTLKNWKALVRDRKSVVQERVQISVVAVSLKKKKKKKKKNKKKNKKKQKKK